MCIMDNINVQPLRQVVLALPVYMHTLVSDGRNAATPCEKVDLLCFDDFVCPEYENYFETEIETTIKDEVSECVDFEIPEGFECGRGVLPTANIPGVYMEQKVLCLFRIAYEKTHRYLVSFADDLELKIHEIDDKYNCDWNIEIISIKHASEDDEVKVKYALYQKKMKLSNGTYAIHYDIYKYLSKKAEYKNPFYAFEDGQETYLGRKITDADHTS